MKSFEESTKIASELDEEDMLYCYDFSNFVFSSDSENNDDAFDECSTAAKRIKRFQESLKQKCKNSADSFYNAILWGIYFVLKGIMIILIMKT